MTAISTFALAKRYQKVVALESLDLQVADNVVFGFLGPNGAGKTTTVKLLTGFARATSGRAVVADEEVDQDNVALRSKIGLLPDVPAFYDWMSAREFLRFVASLHSLTPLETRKRTQELLALVGLEKDAKRKIGGYSRGMRQRLGIAQALVNRPRVLFMDEPTSALDPIGRKEILDLIRSLRETTTVFMSTHILSDVERVCDIVGIINKGKLVTVSSVEALQKQYARSVFEIEFAEDAREFLETLRKTPWLADPHMAVANGAPVVRVKAGDVDQALKSLPQLIAASGLTMTRYELVRPSIEEIFMEVMNAGGKK